MIENSSDSKIENATLDYENTLNELRKYDSDSQKLLSFISLLITIAFVVGVEKKIEIIFPFVPFLSLFILQYLITNNFAYRVREKYAHKLEGFLNSKNGEFPGLYSRQIKSYYLKLKWWELLLHPFSGAIIFSIILIFLITGYSIIRALEYLKTNTDEIISTAYLIIFFLLITYSVFSLIWSLRKLNNS